MKKNITIQELKNWFYIKATIKKEKMNPGSLWNKYKLRNNWYGRIYTVISLREEDLGEEMIVQNWKAMEMMRPINEYLSSKDLHEIIFPSIERIPESRSYLIVYSPIIPHLTFTKFFIAGLVVASLIFGIVYAFA